MINFSVLLSLYEKEKPKYLQECLESLKNQTFQANEIIIVFDGKISQELENVVQDYSEKLPIKNVRLPKNVGLGNALNEGLKYCSNEWVFRMDTDDICFSNRFEKQVEYIKNNPEIVLFSSHICEFENGIENVKSQRKVPIGYEKIKKSSLIKNPFNHMTVVFKKSVVQKVGGYHHHLYFEDWNLWLRIIADGNKVGNIDEPLLYARVNDMISRRKGVNYVKSEWQLFQLKQKLGLEHYAKGFLFFILRSLPRLLPVFLLKKIYQMIRKK